MAVKIKTLTDPNTGEQVAPRTLVEAIVNVAGESLPATLRNLDLNKASNADLELVNQRISNLVANSGEQTEGNEELIDIRVGADGTVYPTAGDAVRNQVNMISDKLIDYLHSTELQAKLEQGTFPYNSVDDFPVNTVISINYPTCSEWLANMPSDDFTGPIVTLSYSSSAVAGKVQLGFGSKRIYWRRGYNATGTYDAWKSEYDLLDTLLSTDFLHSTGNNATAEQGTFPYTNVAEFPNNTIISIGSPLASTWLSGLPADDFVGLIITMHYAKSLDDTTVKGGGIQIAYGHRCIKFRMNFNVTGTYGSWRDATQGAICASTLHVKDTNMYTSFNDLPNNSVVVISTTALTDSPIEGKSYGTYIAFNYTTNENYGGEIQILFDKSDLKLKYRQAWGSKDGSVTWSDWKTQVNNEEITSLEKQIELLKTLETYPPLITSFLKIGCIGDSMSSGECKYTNVDGTTSLVDLYEHSWGQYMARKYGLSVVNLSQGGLTTRSWFTSSYGYTLAIKEENKCNAYIIGLGINDRNKLGSEYLGTIDDIDIDNADNNNDTFYGNYAKIIQKMKKIQPKAKFFLMLDPNKAVDEEFQNATAEIATLFENCYVLDMTLYADLYSSSGFIGQQNRGHYNAISYNYMGTLIGAEISKYMYVNHTEFNQIEFIDTDYNYKKIV